MIKNREIRYVRGLFRHQAKFKCDYTDSLQSGKCVNKDRACIPFKLRPCIVIKKLPSRDSEYLVVELTSRAPKNDGIVRKSVGCLIHVGTEEYAYDVPEVYHESFFDDRVLEEINLLKYAEIVQIISCPEMLTNTASYIDEGYIDLGTSSVYK